MSPDEPDRGDLPSYNHAASRALTDLLHPSAPAPERPDLTAQRAELTGLIARISMRPEQLGDLLGTLLSYVPIHDWAALEADLRREHGVPGSPIVPTNTSG